MSVASRAAEFHEEHVLADGTKITLRAIRPDDAEELHRCFARLSPRSRYQRFLGGVGELSAAMIEYLTRVDGERHVAIVATTESHDLKSEVGLGVARFVRLQDEPGVAEAAITVVDDAQGRGIGRLLMRALATLAAERGVRVFRGEVLADNARMRHLLEAAGATTRAADDRSAPLASGETLVFDVPVQAPDGELPGENPLRRLLRAIAEEIKKLPHPPALPPAENHDEA